jgi:methionyl aminopeptidase
VIHYKSTAELDKMRRSGRILADNRPARPRGRRPGRTTADLDAVAEERIAAAGAISNFKGYRGTYPASICTSVNSEIVHGIPSASRVLQEGDLLSLDFGCIWEGYHSDSAVSVFVGGVVPSADAERLVKTTESALYAAIEAVVPGARLTDIGAAIEAVAAPRAWASCAEYGGHGIGRAMHEDPFIQNYGPPGRGPRAEAGPDGRARAHAEPRRRGDPPAGRRLDRRDGRRIPVRALRAHGRGHRGRRTRSSPTADDGRRSAAGAITSGRGAHRWSSRCSCCPRSPARRSLMPAVAAPTLRPDIVPTPTSEVVIRLEDGHKRLYLSFETENAGSGPWRCSRCRRTATATATPPTTAPASRTSTATRTGPARTRRGSTRS